jgi:acyl-coenzyme A thioesterase PaaI-like protein
MPRHDHLPNPRTDSFRRPLDTGPVTAEEVIMRPGRRIALAEGRIADDAGKPYTRHQ